MKKRITALICLLTLLTICLAGCGSKKSSAGQNSPNTGQSGAPAAASGQNPPNTDQTGSRQPSDYVKPEMKGTITISTMYELEFLETAAENFMKQYPGVKVEIHTAMELSDNDTDGKGKIEQYRTELNTRIMSGKAEDIICTQVLPVRKYMQIGAFEDLSSYLAASPEFNEEQYFTNVLQAAKDETGKICLLPYKASFDVLSFDRTIIKDDDHFQDKKSLRFSEAAAYARNKMDAAKQKNTYLTQQGPDGYMQALISENRDDLIDWDNKKANIGSQYIKWLQEARQLQDDGYFNPPGLDFYNTKYYFAMNSDYDVQAGFYNLYPDASCYGKPTADAKGNVYTSASDCLAISSSQNKGVAWEFIKYVLSAEIQSHPSMAAVGLPVNRQGFAAAAERVMNMYTEGTKTNVSAEDYKTLMEQWVSQINKCELMDSSIYGYFAQENQKFFDGKQTAEQTAKNLQNKLTQILRE